MDKRRLVLVITLTMALLFLFQLFMGHLSKLHPDWDKPATQPTAQPAPTTTPAPTTATSGLSVSTGSPAASTTPSTAVVPTTNQAEAPVAPSSMTTAPVAAGITATSTTQAANVTLGSTIFDPKKKGPYAMGVELSPTGASVQRVVLNAFRKRVDKDEPYDFQHPCPVASEYSAALATRSITVDGSTVPLSDKPWRLDSSSPTSATFSVDIHDIEGGALLTLRKTFKLTQRTDPSLGYELAVSYAVENTSGKSVDVKIAFNGTNVMAMENNRDAAMIIDATDAGDAAAHVVNIKDHEHPILGFKDNKPVDLKEKDRSQPFLWAGVRSNYFDAYIRFLNDDGKLLALDEAKSFALTPTAKDDNGEEHTWAPPSHEVKEDAIIKNVVTGFQTVQQSVASRSTLSVPVTVYLGPAAREVLDTAYYTSYPRRYSETLIISSGFCGILTMAWLVNVLVAILGALHFVFRDWGLAIIGLVILVRTLLHPISKRSQVSMMKMGKMGPEMEKLKKKYGDDKEGLNKAMMQFYKTQGISPLLGCLPLFLQMPIWIALWNALQSTFEIRHAPFLWGFTWIKDLAQPDKLLTLQHPIPLIFGFEFPGLNVLPLLLAGVSFFQQKVMQPQNTSAMTPEQQQQQKMMKWMSVILFPLMFYTSPSGLMLYIITSNALAIVEGQIVRKHIREQEEKEKAGLVIVDEPVPATVKRVAKAGVVAKSPPATGVAGWMARIQAQVEQIAQDAQKPQKKGKRK